MSVALESQSEQIRSRMAKLRLHMDRDARQIIANTNQLFDWKDYVKHFPKALVAAGLIAGFVIGPGRKVVPSVNLSQNSIDERLKQRPQQSVAEVSQRSEIASGAFKMLTGLAMTGVSILVRKGVENYFNSHAKANESDTDGRLGSK